MKYIQITFTDPESQQLTTWTVEPDLKSLAQLLQEIDEVISTEPVHTSIPFQA